MYVFLVLNGFFELFLEIWMFFICKCLLVGIYFFFKFKKVYLLVFNVEFCRLELDKLKDWLLGIEGDKWWWGGENGCNIFNIENLKIWLCFKVEFGFDYFGYCDKYLLICCLVFF